LAYVLPPAQLRKGMENGIKDLKLPAFYMAGLVVASVTFLKNVAQIEHGIPI